MKAISPQRKTAVILFNLGGPEKQASVQPFLFNLFNDPAIIGLPLIFRRLLAMLISRRRAPKAQKIYEELGGGSPILENTQAQARALENSLRGHGEVKVFITMRYWHPMSEQTAREVKAYAPEHIILLPLYPQFSTTTTGSSFTDWDRAAASAGLDAPTSRICCYPTQEDFIKSHAQLVRTYVEEASHHGTPRILFSAHGLPEKIIARGDPYQWQVEETTRAVMSALGSEVDHINCYQSRVGPMKWIGPSTEDEILRAAKDGVPVVLVPIAFVSEHSETLVELDIEYAALAHDNGLDRYYRVPTLSVQAHFIAALADLCLKQTTTPTCGANAGGRICPKHLTQCGASRGLLPAH
jgi:ferrochelatase